MNCKTALTTRTIPVFATVSRITVFICFIGACSFAHAANVTWSGQLDLIAEDSGGTIYSGVAIGTDFSGAIDDVTFNGFVTDGTTQTSFDGAPDEDSLEVVNNFLLDAEIAALINPLAGTSFVAGDAVDLVFLRSRQVGTPGGGTLDTEIVFVFDAGVLDDDSLENYPPNPDVTLVTLVIIEEEDNQGDTIYEGFVVADELTFTEDVFQINAAISDAWFFPATSGQGFFIIVWEDSKLIFLSWFTYDTELPPEGVTANFGWAGQRWLTALGSFVDDTALLDVFLSSGMIFDSADPPVTTEQLEGATIEIVWSGCNAGVLKYNIPSLGLSGEIPIERIVLDKVAACLAAQPQ